MKRLLLLLTSFVLVASVARAVEPVSDYRLVLSGPSVAEAVESARAQGQTATAVDRARVGRDYKAAVLAEQADLENELSARGLAVVSRTSILLNSVTVHAPPSRLDELKSLPGVLSVHPVRHYKRALATSVPFVGAPTVWATTNGFTGKGVRIGILDSGIDYTHADFGGSGKKSDYVNNDPTIVEPGSFPTAKVAGGTDLAGDDYDADGNFGSTTPSPDADPLDTPVGGNVLGHGTHVAGIAAGIGVLANGASFKGPYGPGIYTNHFTIGPGVAPEALLYAIKIFGAQGSTGLVPEALDWAADPNGDGNTDDHLDVANLSLGSDFGVQDTTDPESQAVSRLVHLGCVVVIAAGNEGNTSYVVGSPGVTPEATTVANIYDNGVAFTSIHVSAPPAIVGDYADVEAEFTPKLSVTGPITAQVVYTIPNDACSTIINAAALNGKIALLDRGTCFFSDKVRNAQQAGAIGVIVVNNQPGAPIGMAGQGDTTDIAIPAVMISINDGNTLKGALTNGLTATLAATAPIVHPELADVINESSSRGPALYNSKLKPDLSAPGSDITSAESGSGTNGIAYTGTSMATPHVAGAAALLKQQHPTWSAYDIKAALMNTASPSHDSAAHLYPESRTGAGRIAVEAASQTMVLVHNANPAAEVSLSYGAFELMAPTNLTHTIRIDNRGPTATFTIAVSNTVAQPGVTATPEFNTIDVASNTTATVDINISIDPSQLRPQPDLTSPSKIGDRVRFQLAEASGEVYVSSGLTKLHVPWQLTARALSSYQLAATNADLPPGDSVTLPAPTAGTSTHPQPLVSVFELGTSSPSQKLTFPDSAGDLLAVGAATDLAVAPSFDDARVFFGLVVDGKWTTPQRALQNLDIEIDLNNDGNPDYNILNSSYNNVLLNDLENPELATDALLSGSYVGASSDSSTATGVIAGSSWNVLDPGFRDTAPYHNAAMVHGVLAKSIGLSPTQTQFRYRATTFGPDITATSAPQDITSWITYDIAKPKIDPTPYGLKSSPFFDEGAGVQVLVNRTNVPAGATNVSALFIHQHNQPGSQIDILNVNLASALDSDHNGLPDAWELTYFGHLGNSAQDDPDHDGATNAQELAAGTNPTDPNSVFKIVSVKPAATSSGNTIQWLSVLSRSYDLERSTNLSSGFTAVATNVSGINGTDSANDANPPAHGPVFYRVKVH